MEKSTLLTQTGLELDCVILFKKDKEGLVFCQNRLIKVVVEEDYCSEIEVLIDWCIMPEVTEFLRDVRI